MRATVSHASAGRCSEMKGQARLLCQFRWESVDVFTAEEISRDVIPCLLTMAGSLGQASETSGEAGSELEELATLIIKARHTPHRYLFVTARAQAPAT